MIELDVVEPIERCRGWGTPAFLVKKKAERGQHVAPRVVYEYRGLNATTGPDGYASPNITTCLDQLTGSKHFSKMDLFSGFWHVPIREKDRHKTTICTHVGLFQMKRMPFGLRNAPACFQRLVNTAFMDLLYPSATPENKEVFSDPLRSRLCMYVDDLLAHDQTSVSYTHLTLPTKRIV